jgi:hypothetical protein
MAESNIFSEGAMPHSRAVLSSRVRIFGVGSRNATSSGLKGTGPKGFHELVGAISSFGVSSSRNLEAVRGIGLGDHIIEMVPGQSEPLSLSITRAALAVANMFQEFGYQGGVDGLVRALKHHRYPVDIKQELLISNMADNIGSYSASDGVVIDPTPGKKPSEDFKSIGYKYSDKLTGLGNKNGFKALVTWYEGCWFEDFNVTYGVDAAVISEEGTIKVTDVSGFDSGELVIPVAVSENASQIWYPSGV